MYDIGIIGGGFFGMYIAEYFARQGKKVFLCEREGDFMQGASYLNQARVHNGYHYPRSVLTAFRSRISFPRFIKEFPDCIDSSFEKYYMIGKILGKVTARQFEKFCHRIGAYCEAAPQRITKLVNPNLIESVFIATEYAFDAIKLKHCMLQRISNAGVDYRLNTLACRVATAKDQCLAITIHPLYRSEEKQDVHAQQVFNCTYSMLNYAVIESGLNIIPLKHEMTEMAIIEVPEELQDKGITVMCGPFFSVMPFPPRRLHSFSHVRYTPHYEWYDREGEPYINAYQHFVSVQKQTAWSYMIHDAQRYIPILSECRYHDSLWAVKTILPRSEVDDSRPILFKPNYGFKGFHCILGGKIDNIYDAIAAIDRTGLA